MWELERVYLGSSSLQYKLKQGWEPFFIVPCEDDERTVVWLKRNNPFKGGIDKPEIIKESA